METKAEKRIRELREHDNAAETTRAWIKAKAKAIREENRAIQDIWDAPVAPDNRG